MIERIIEASIRHRLLVLLLSAALIGTGIWSLRAIRLDALPDLSDVQVIVTTEYPGQNPEVVEDQLTYPLSTALLSVPGARTVRGYSMFEQSFVYVLFEDGTDLYWARSRVLEYLNFVRDRLPEGVEPKLGPDATGVGWVYQYVLAPGYYSPQYPQGLWHDEEREEWYEKLSDVPASRKGSVGLIRTFEEPGTCPLSGQALVKAEFDLAELRSLQDWYLRYPLTSVAGVSEVASLGGFVRQYQVILDPIRLLAFRLSSSEVVNAIQRSNNDVGGSVIEKSENEYMVRSRGYLKGVEDLRKVPVGLGENGTPIYLREVADVVVGGEARRGIGELDGIGEAVGGIIVARFGENAYEVIKAAKKRLAELEQGLPPGLSIKTTYDRSQLIERSVTTLRNTLIEEIVVVGIVCLLFLLHARSELVAVIVVPSSVLLAILVMNLLGINANIMSLGGIALSIGVVVDSAIVMVENAHKHLDREELERAQGRAARSRAEVIAEAAKEVGPQLFFSLLIITVSFLPVFMLGGESGRLFKPLAFTKTFSMAAASLLSITLVPVLMVSLISTRVLPGGWTRKQSITVTVLAMLIPALLIGFGIPEQSSLFSYRWWLAFAWSVIMGMLLIPQKIIHEEKSPLSRVLQSVYEPAFAVAMRHRKLVLLGAVLALLSTIYPWTKLGTEFMPPLDEGDLLYMPTTDPSISITKSRELLQQTDKLIASLPEVISVHGKIGRADTATDPAPLSMIETVIRLNPDRSTWRTRGVDYFFSSWPAWLKAPLTKTFWPERRTISTQELVYGWTEPDGSFHPGLNTIVRFPGLTNAWPYPIENRLNMLSTGVKTPVGIKVIGPDLAILAELAEEAAETLRSLNGTVSAYSERSTGGYYLDIDVDREAAARYGMTLGDVQDNIRTAIGGMNISTTIEGRARYPINVRYPRELRDDLPALRNLLVTTPNHPAVPLGQLASLEIKPGPPMIRSENAERTAWVYVDVRGVDLGQYISEAQAALAAELSPPAGYRLVFTGQFEAWEETLPRLLSAGALTVVTVIVLLYVGSGSWLRVGIILLAVPFSLIGALWFLYLLDYNLSLATMIGIIALAGLDAETGMVMLLYLDSSLKRFQQAGAVDTESKLYEAVHDGAVKRIRPKAMTVLSALIGLMPLLWAEGAGADTMRRVAAPLIGGLSISFLMELIIFPVLFYEVKRRSLMHVK